MTAATKALVLGGGGVAGIAWETGVLAGLAAQGVVLTDADLVVGTSAGSTVAAQFLGGARSIEDLYREQIKGSGAPEPKIDVDLRGLLDEMASIIEANPDPLAARKTIGAISLESNRVSEEYRLRIIKSRLGDARWPELDLAITAIDAHTGEFVTLRKGAGVSLTDAVAASCAIPGVWPAVTIFGRRYYDGGIRSGTNTDVASGYSRVLVLEVMESPSAGDVQRLGAETSEMVVRPDVDSAEALTDLMDPAARAIAGKAGFEQGLSITKTVREFWRGNEKV